MYSSSVLFAFLVGLSWFGVLGAWFWFFFVGVFFRGFFFGAGYKYKLSFREI